jgi:RNA polymerase sigma-70 factor, ECF subfamily
MQDLEVASGVPYPSQEVAMPSQPEVSRKRIASYLVPLSSLNQLSEEALLDAARSGNHAAFEELMSRSLTTCVRVIHYIVQNVDDVEEELQNTYSRAYEHLRNFNSESKFSTWVTRIAINSCYARCKDGQKRKALPFTIVDHDGQFYSPYDKSPGSPESDLGRTQVSEAVRLELQHLPSLLREPLVLRFLEGLSVDQVAERLGISRAAAKSRLFRARVSLHERMMKHCGRRGLGTLTR